MSHLEFHNKFKKLAQAERELLVEIIRVIQECDTRRIYLELGYPNLFTYMVEGLGYSAGAAQRRIDAARLSREIPAVAEKLESGEMTLSHVSMIQKASRRKPAGMGAGAAASAGVAAKDLKKKAVEAASNQSHAQTEKLVAEIFELPVAEKTIIKTQANESVRIEITLTKEQFEKLQSVREELSHQVPDGDFAKVIEILSEQKITRKLTATVAVDLAVPVKPVAVNSESLKSVPRKTKVLKPDNKVLKSNNKPLKSNNKTLTPKTRQAILQRDQVCQYRSPITGKLCASRWHLQVDHLQPRWAGGNHDPQNLQVLCGQHNRMKYKKEAGYQMLE